MPNTAVKPANAESTWGEAPWEDRKPLSKEKALAYASAFLRFVVRGPWERAASYPTRVPWDKQGTGFEGALRRAKPCESLMPNLVT